MTEISDKLVEKQVDQLKNRDDVKAVAVVGSYARNPDGDHNDLDIYAVVDGKWRKRVTEEVDGVVVEKFFNSFQWTLNYFEKDSWAHHYRWMTEGNVKYDPDNLFEDIIEEAEKVKEEKLSLSETEEKEISYTIWDMQQDIAAEDVGQKRFMMNQLFHYLVEKQYYLKNQLPVKENYRLERLQEFDGYMYKLAQDFLLASSTMEKQNRLDKLVDHVSRNLPSISPEWETEKEEM